MWCDIHDAGAGFSPVQLLSGFCVAGGSEPSKSLQRSQGHTLKGVRWCSSSSRPQGWLRYCWMFEYWDQHQQL